MENKNVLYVRSGPYKVNINNYNLQEIGFSKQLCNKGFNCDILYYSNKNYDECIYECNGKKVTILWRKGIKILRSGIYPQILNKSYLSRYDFIIATEYSQIMTVLLSLISPNVIIYNGPYYNLFKLKFCEKIYDRLFVKILNKNSRMIFTKSILAKNYLIQKGFENIKVLGVGLDETNFQNEISLNKNTKDLIKFMKKNKCILYVGSLDKRKNFDFIIRVFEKVNYINPSVNLIVIGNGNKKYVDYSFNQVNSKVRKKIIHIKSVNNKCLKYIYSNSNLFLLPSKYEIFGMVLLEAMYFGVPVITSENGGSTTLINNHNNGVILNSFDELLWVNEIKKILNNNELAKYYSRNAKETIINNFTWKSIVKKLLIDIEE